MDATFIEQVMRSKEIEIKKLTDDKDRLKREVRLLQNENNDLHIMLNKMQRDSIAQCSKDMNIKQKKVNDCR